jgi:hypothetical protein
LFKRITSKIVLILFLGIVISPTAIIAIDSTIDISMFFGVAEENEEKVNEKNIEIESLLFKITEKEHSLILNSKKKKGFYVFKKYSKPHLNLVFPPPDFLLS